MLEKNKLMQEAENAINWIKQYVSKANSNGVVVGNSGGKDSATVIAMAVKALGQENVLTVAMPCNSLKEDLDDAKLVADTFGVKLLSIDLLESYSSLEKEINIQLGDLGRLTNESLINVKPRLRMTTLYAIAQTLNYLVIGTGNLCERMVGYTTKWGDSGVDFNPIGNFTVEEVLQIGKHLGVPEKILKKEPNDGLGGQSDEEKMGIKYCQISEMIETGDTDELAKKEILRKFKISEHKRNTVPIYTFERENLLY